MLPKPPQIPATTAAESATIVLSPAAAAEAMDKAQAAETGAATPAEATATTGPGKYIGIAAAIVLIALVVWKFGSGRSDVIDKEKGAKTPPVSAAGSVVLDIAPWANIDAITKKADGKAASGGCTVTPCVISLPAGEYHVRASNPNFQGPLEFDLTVEAGGIREVRQAIPGFKPEDEVSKILDK
jgi:hypothetical protein